MNQERASDQAELMAEHVYINELSRQSKTATTNIDMERQLATAGKDIRDLMTAGQLHVVDVGDTDPNGKDGNAFGRVFLTEGKSLILYAFDLNDAKRLTRHRLSEFCYLLLSYSRGASQYLARHLDWLPSNPSSRRTLARWHILCSERPLPETAL